MSAPASRKPLRPGVELYTVRNALATDPAATLGALAAAGIEEIECFYTPATPLQAIRASGIDCVSVFLDSKSAIEPQLEAASSLKARFVVYACTPELCAPEQPSEQNVQAVAERFTGWARQAQAAGLRFAFHPHAHEYRAAGRLRAVDLLMSLTDPKLVELEMDMGWAHVGGADTAMMLTRYRGRIPLVHVKDRDPAIPVATGGDSSVQFVTLGEGKLDYETLIPIARATGVEHFLLETDHPKDALANVSAGVAWFKARPWL